jgi:hypothetical protein
MRPVEGAIVSAGASTEPLIDAPTPTEVKGLQAFEDAYNAYWQWPSEPVDPDHPIQLATLHAIRAAVRAMIDGQAPA